MFNLTKIYNDAVDKIKVQKDELLEKYNNLLDKSDDYYSYFKMALKIGLAIEVIKIIALFKIAKRLK